VEANSPRLDQAIFVETFCQARSLRLGQPLAVGLPLIVLKFLCARIKEHELERVARASVSATQFDAIRKPDRLCSPRIMTKERTWWYTAQSGRHPRPSSVLQAWMEHAPTGVESFTCRSKRCTTIAITMLWIVLATLLMRCRLCVCGCRVSITGVVYCDGCGRPQPVIG
jgi:hypothetical protein